MYQLSPYTSLHTKSSKKTPQSSKMLATSYLLTLTTLVLSTAALPFNLWHFPTAEPTATFPTMTLVSETFVYPSGTGTGTGINYLPTAPAYDKRDVEERDFPWSWPTGTGTATRPSHEWPTGFHWEKRQFGFPASFPTSWPTGASWPTGRPYEKLYYAFPTSFPSAFPTGSFPTGGFPFEKRE